MKVILAVSAVLCACVLSVQGILTCRIKGAGIVNTFGGAKGHIRLPCRYLASDSNCMGYNIRVEAKQAFDKLKNYFTDRVWVFVKEIATGKVWKGSTDSMRSLRYLRNIETELFNVVEGSLAVNTVADIKRYKVSLEQKDTKDGWRVNVYLYDIRVRKSRTNAGVEIICPDADFENTESYPTSLCGNSTQTKVFHDRKRDLGMNRIVEGLLYDQLVSNTIGLYNAGGYPYPTSACGKVVKEFKSCPIDKGKVVKLCHPLVTNKWTSKCLNRNGYDPMKTFTNCIMFLCTDNVETCWALKDAMDDCTRLEGLADKCPLMGLGMD